MLRKTRSKNVENKMEETSTDGRLEQARNLAKRKEFNSSSTRSIRRRSNHNNLDDRARLRSGNEQENKTKIR